VTPWISRLTKRPGGIDYGTRTAGDMLWPSVVGKGRVKERGLDNGY